MKDASLRKLVRIGSDPLSEKAALPVPEALAPLLSAKNGFYAFESALLVRGSNYTGPECSLEQWNDPTLWIRSYGDMADGCFFFAEDIFGMQFCIRDGKFYAFDAETAALEFLAEDAEQWCEVILADYNYRTGSSIAQEWQRLHGALPRGKRLAPKIPFVTGGAFEVSNLFVSDVVKLMTFRGMLAQKIRNLPDGTKISFKVE